MPAPDAPPTGASLFATCIGCHGTAAQGNAKLRAPVLAGLGSWYVTEQLKKFRAGWRGAHPMDAAGSSMRPMAATLPDEDAIRMVADHIGSLPIAEPDAPRLRGNAARGASLYAACAGCHGIDGKGNEGLKAPALLHQADWYLATQLRNFKSGARGAHPADSAGGMMRPMAAGLADETAIADVVTHIVTLRGGTPPVAEGSEAAVATPAEENPAPAEGEPASEEDTTTDETAAATNVVLAGDAAKGQALFATCMACHGTDGRGNEALQAPQIAGQEPWYLSTQLRNFKNGVRGAHPQDVKGMQMRPMAMMLADDQAIADVAAHVHGLQPGSGKITLGGDATKGQQLYTSCIACHGMDGKGNAALKAPSLAGQQDWYLARQLLNFRAGIRGAHQDDAAGALMRPMAATLADEVAIHDVAAYLATLGRTADEAREPKAPETPKEDDK